MNIGSFYHITESSEKYKVPKHTHLAHVGQPCLGIFA